MRAWENRPDTVVVDEPFYAHYLLEHGLDHPGREEVLAHHDSDAARVASWLKGPIPKGKTVWYQKHMAHHLLEDVPRDWFSAVTHVFLIREPREMLASLARVLPEPTLDDTGLPQQLEIFEHLRAELARSRGATPPIVDARDVLLAPRRLLGALCDAIGVPFAEQMLSWPRGPRASDGVWAPHWYTAVLESTGFEPYRAKPVEIPTRLAPVLAAAEDIYGRLHDQRLR
jgi:hypothetical protein